MADNQLLGGGGCHHHPPHVRHAHPVRVVLHLLEGEGLDVLGDRCQDEAVERDPLEEQLLLLLGPSPPCPLAGDTGGAPRGTI